jgi:hypothetical protein
LGAFSQKSDGTERKTAVLAGGGQKPNDEMKNGHTHPFVTGRAVFAVGHSISLANVFNPYPLPVLSPIHFSI